MGALHTSQCYVRQSGKDSKGKTEKYCFFECPRANSQSALTGSLSQVQVKHQIYHSGCDVVLIPSFLKCTTCIIRDINVKLKHIINPL